LLSASSQQPWRPWLPLRWLWIPATVLHSVSCLSRCWLPTHNSLGIFGCFSLGFDLLQHRCTVFLVFLDVLEISCSFPKLAKLFGVTDLAESQPLLFFKPAW
jgi:hypothetical protein